jgi:exodeoxyribonuclease VII large subunit
VDHASARVEGLAAQVRALSPAGTLERGYAVVQDADGRAVRDPEEVAVGDPLRVRVARGAFAASVVGTDDPGAAAPRAG